MKHSFLILMIIALLLPIASVNNAYCKNSSGKSFIKVVYFHGDYRCPTCNKLEEYSKEAVKKYFSEDMASGKVFWDAINYDKEENEHYIDEFNLYNKSLIIMKFDDGKLKDWKNLEKIWELVSDKSKYFDYVKKEIEQYK